MNPRYECPPMIPAREWKSLVEYGKKMDLRKEGKLPPSTGRYAIHTFSNVIINLILLIFRSNLKHVIYFNIFIGCQTHQMPPRLDMKKLNDTILGLVVIPICKHEL